MPGSENSAAKEYRPGSHPPSQMPESMVVPRRRKDSNKVQEGGILFTHPSSDLNTVMNEVLLSNPDSSYTFLNEGKLRSRMGLLRDEFLPDMEERRITYAMKANSRRRILEILSEEGVDGFDCASLNEVILGMDYTEPEGIYFNHPIKKRADIYAAHQHGVRYFTAQSRSGIEKILSAPMTADARENTDLAIRVATPNKRAAIDLTTDKFGAHPEVAMAGLDVIRAEGFRPGLAMNTGSQNADPFAFQTGIEVLAAIAERKGGVDSINLGGGIPINYSKEDHFDGRNFLQIISGSVRQNARRLLSDHSATQKIILELGRYFVADSVDLTVPILEIDKRNGVSGLYIDDGIFTSFSDWPIHRWRYNYDIFTRDGRKLPPERESYVIHGRTCDSGDTLGRVDLPVGLKEGDCLWVRNAGAYMDSQASYFNGFDPPGCVSYNS